MALTGELTDLSLAELIEFFCNQRKTGRLAVTYPQGSAYFYLQAGAVVHASLGTLCGIEAVYYALTLSNASFNFDSTCEAPDHTINQPWTSVVLEGLRRMDEGIYARNPFPQQAPSTIKPTVVDQEMAEPIKHVDSRQDEPRETSLPETHSILTEEGLFSHSEAVSRFAYGPWKLGAIFASLILIVGVIAVLTTLANPYGWKLHSHIYHYLSNRFLMDHIDEFQSPNFHGVAQRCFAGLILIAFVALGARARRERLSEGLVVLFAVYSGLVASRNIPVSSLLLVLVAGPLLSEAFAKIRWHRFLRWGRGAELRSAVPTFLARMGALELGLRGHVWVVLAVVLSSWIVLHGGVAGSSRLMDAHFDATRFPVKAVDFVAQQGLPEPVLGPDYWGGYLIYRLYPTVQVVADDRHDLYGEEFFKFYLKMVHVEPGWYTLIREQGVRRVLMPKGSPVANILAESVGWQMVYEDNVAVLFEKR